MPIYEYRCEDCGNEFEKLVRRTEDLQECPQCGQTHLEQLLSTFAAGGKDDMNACLSSPAWSRKDSAGCGHSCGCN